MDFYDIQGLSDSSDSDSSDSNDSIDSNASSNLNESTENAAVDVDDELNQHQNELLTFTQKVWFLRCFFFNYKYQSIKIYNNNFKKEELYTQYKNGLMFISKQEFKEAESLFENLINADILLNLVYCYIFVFLFILYCF